jgi:glycosyltransferase involved in cell wall biosynthesis
MTIITPLMREEICDRFHIDPRFVGVWTSGVSQELFKPDRHILKGTELKRRIGLNGKFLIIYHGVFTSERGLGKLVDSIALLEDKYRTITLFLLGTGPALAELRKSIQEKGIHDRVVIHEPVDLAEVPKYIAMCDAGILTLPDLPIWRYQCPLKLLEYLAMEKVAIVTDLPASREIIGNSKCGIYASSAQPEDIAKAIMYAYDNKEKLGEWGAHGRKVIEERYTWTKVAEDLDRYLTDC